MAHNLLPVFSIIGENDTFCSYCRKKNGLNNREDIEHVFIYCIIPSMVWGKINLKLHRQGMGGIELEKDTIIYKLGLTAEMAMLVAEINWALWKNRNNNTRMIGNNVGGAVVVTKMYKSRLEKFMRVDKKV